MAIFDAFSLPPADLYRLLLGLSDLRRNRAESVMRSTLSDQFSNLLTVHIYPENGINVGYAVLCDGTNTLVLIDGVRTQVQAQRVIDGYSGTLIQGFRNPTNVYLEENADMIRSRMDGLGVWQVNKVLFAGYSAGGAIAPLVPIYRQVRKANDPEMRVVSFGSPRTGGTPQTNFMHEITQKERYFFFDDPIAAFPLRSGTYTWLPFLIGARPARRWAEFVHFPGGIQVESNGGYTYQNQPENVVVTAPTAFDVWWNQMNAVALSPHNFERYLDAFAVSLQRGRPHSGGVPATPERPESLPPTEITRQERQTVNIVRDIQQTQDQTKLVIPPARLATAYRQGRVWYVSFGGTAIMSTPSRRRAQGAANELNAFIRRMQRTAIVDPAAVVAQMQAYLELASDPASGITPTLNTRIP